MIPRPFLAMLLVWPAPACEQAESAESEERVAAAGFLDKDIIRDVVRDHLPDVRYCYNRGLVHDPKLAGRIVVDFTIGEHGGVSASNVTESTLDDAAVGDCVAEAVLRWRFPAPENGPVSVVYPFALEPG